MQDGSKSMGPTSPTAGVELPCAAPYASLGDPRGRGDLLGSKAASTVTQPSPWGPRGVPALGSCCSRRPRACKRSADHAVPGRFAW